MRRNAPKKYVQQRSRHPRSPRQAQSARVATEKKLQEEKDKLERDIAQQVSVAWTEVDGSELLQDMLLANDKKMVEQAEKIAEKRAKDRTKREASRWKRMKSQWTDTKTQLISRYHELATKYWDTFGRRSPFKLKGGFLVPWAKFEEKARRVPRDHTATPAHRSCIMP